MKPAPLPRRRPSPWVPGRSFPLLAGIVAGAALLADGTVPCVLALDFQLHSTQVEEDGFTREQFYFQYDERSRVQILLPAGWNHVGEANSLLLTPPQVNNSLVRIEKSALSPGTGFQDKGLEIYRQRVVAGIPQGATRLQWESEKDSPLPIFNWKGHEFTLTYEFFGQAYKRSVLFLNLNAREQLTVTTVAPKESFERVHDAGFDVLRSWQPTADK